MIDNLQQPSYFVVDPDAPPPLSERSRILYSIFAAVSIMGFLSIPLQIVEHLIAPEPAPVVYKLPGLRQAEPWPAPIWSKRCEQQGKSMQATQADGGKWEVHCTGGVRA